MAVDIMPNILHNYASYTYHIKLYRVPHDEHAAITTSEEFEGINLSNIHTYSFSKRVIIAESASTSLAINSLSMTSHASVTDASVAAFKMQITQAKGMSLFESMIKAAEICNEYNMNALTSASFFLEISFMGIDEDGVEYKNIYTITYPVQVINIDMSVGVSGTVYDVALSIAIVPSRTRDTISRVPTTIQLTDIHNTDDFFSKLEKSLNTAYERDRTYRQRFINVCKFIVDDELKGLDFDIDISNRPIGDMMMVANDNTGISFHLPVDIEITRVVESALSNISAVRDMLLGDSIVGKTIHVEPNIVQGEYDEALQAYSNNIFWLVSTKNVYKIPRPNHASTNDNIMELLEAGNISKRYEYIYTGENTEVRNVSLDFSNMYALQLQTYTGIFNNYANNSALSTNAVSDRDEIFESEREQSQDLSNAATPAYVDNTGAEVYYVDSFNEITEEMAMRILPRFRRENATADSNEGISNLSGDSDRAAYLQEIRNVRQIQAANSSEAVLPKIELEIRGDPHWLLSFNVYYRPEDNNHNRRNFNLIYLRLGFPIDETLEQNHIDDFLSALYLVTSIRSEFNNGVFSQTLIANRISTRTPRAEIEQIIEDEQDSDE